MTDQNEPPESVTPVASDALLSAAMSLVGKIKIIHNLPEYKAVWETAQAHRGPYRGPKYDKELDALESAIVAEHEKIFPEEFSSDNAKVDTRDLSRCVPRLVGQVDFQQVSVNTNEFGTNLSFWKSGKSQPELSIQIDPELGQAIFLGLNGYVKKHYPKMFQQEYLHCADSTEPKKPSLFRGAFDSGKEKILRLWERVNSVQRLVRLFGFLFGACCWIGFPLILLGPPTVYLFGMSGGNWFTWSFYALSWVVALVWWFLCFRWCPTREFIETYADRPNDGKPRNQSIDDR